MAILDFYVDIKQLKGRVKSHGNADRCPYISATPLETPQAENPQYYAGIRARDVFPRGMYMRSNFGGIDRLSSY